MSRRWLAAVVVAGADGGHEGGLGAAGASGGSAGSTATGGEPGAPDGAAGENAGGGGAAGSPTSPPTIDGAAQAGSADGGALFGQITCAPGTDGDGKSNLATAAGDPPEWTLQPGSQAGTLTVPISFQSTVYGGQHFPYRVYTSASYVAGRAAIFLLFGDGSEFLGTAADSFHADKVLDNLTSSGDLPPTVALFIDPPSDGDRVQTYDPPTDKYTRFLFTEILPAVIQGKYSISPSPDAWAVVGYSASAGQGWEVLWNEPDNFHKFLGDNSSFGAATTYGVDWVDVIATAPMRPLRVSLLTSTNDLSDQRGMWYVINQQVAQDLEQKGDEWRLVIGMGQHYPPTDGEHDLPNALRWLWRGCHF